MKKIIRGGLFIILAFCAFTLSAQDVPEEPGEEIVFKSGDFVLSGRLVLPDSAQNVPVIIFLGGFYDWGEPHSQRPAFIRENLLNVFPPAGIGVLYYHPRGVGSSDGKWGQATLRELANDAMAAAHYLQQRKEINPNRIGIVGLGEGGWLAQIAAAEHPSQIHLMASLNGATFGANRQLVNQYYSEYVCAGEDSTEAYEKAAQKAQSHQNWVSMLPLTRRWRHMNRKIDFDPSPYIKEISIPALFLFGKNDGRVSADWATEHLTEIFPNGLPSNFSVHSIANANHFFHVVPKCFDYTVEENKAISKNFSFRFKELFQDWMFEHMRSSN